MGASALPIAAMPALQVAGYPRLAALLDAAVARVLRDTAARDVAPGLDEGQAAALLECPADFQAAYLAASLARLTEAAAAAFPGTARALPTAADLQKAIARVHEELKAAAGARALCFCPTASVARLWGWLAGAATTQHACWFAVRPNPAATNQPTNQPPLPAPQARRAWRCWWRAAWARRCGSWRKRQS